MKRVACYSLSWLGLLAALSLLKVPAQAATAESLANLKLGPDRQRVLEEGAKREGSLLIYTSSTGYELIAEAFAKKFPFVKTEVFRTRSEPLTQRILAEARAGRLAADVVKSNVNLYENVSSLLIPFNSPHARYDHVPRASSYLFTGIGFAYSKQRVKAAELPQKVEDLLLPRWKGHLGLHIQPNNYPGRWVGTLLKFMGEEQTRSFLRRLREQDPHFYVTTQAGHNGLLSGEFDVHMRGLTGATEAMWRGEPVGVLGLDPTTLSLDVLGLFKESKNPHAALLFLDWALGEGRLVASKSEGSWTFEEVEKREKDGIKLPKRIRVEEPEDVKHLKRWMELFQQQVVGK